MKIYVANELKKLDVDISRKLFSIAKENKISFYPSPLQAKITKYLIENNKREVYQKELEEVFEVRKATISGVLFTMEKNEVIKRVASENDARQKKIVLTKKSKKIYEEVKETFKKLDEEITKNISEEELNNFLSTIEKIRKNIVRHLTNKIKNVILVKHLTNFN